MRSENDACISTQVPLQLELWAPEIIERRRADDKKESRVVVIDLVAEDDSAEHEGVVVIEL